MEKWNLDEAGKKLAARIIGQFTRSSDSEPVLKQMTSRDAGSSRISSWLV
jgi:hypothetical protein